MRVPNWALDVGCSMLDVFISRLRIQHQIGFRFADTRQTRAGLGAGALGREIVHLAGFDGHEAGAAIAGAATGINFDATRFREIQ